MKKRIEWTNKNGGTMTVLLLHGDAIVAETSKTGIPIAEVDDNVLTLIEELNESAILSPS